MELRIWRVKPWGFESPLSHQKVYEAQVDLRFRLCLALCHLESVQTPAFGLAATDFASQPNATRKVICCRNRNRKVTPSRQSLLEPLVFLVPGPLRQSQLRPPLQPWSLPAIRSG